MTTRLPIPGIASVGTDLVLRAAAQTPFAAGVRAGIAAERRARKILEDYQAWHLARCGVGSQREVTRLRELVRHLEYRVETLVAERTDSAVPHREP